MVDLIIGVFVATAYCCVGSGGGYCGATASGAIVAPGQIAADWRVLPRGTRVHVPGYGNAVVTDTGGDIVGNRIDVFYTHCPDAIAWGRRTVTLTRPAPVPPPPPEPAWVEVVEEVTYWDADAWVRKTVTDSNLGRRTAYEVLPPGYSPGAAPGDEGTD